PAEPRGPRGPADLLPRRAGHHQAAPREAGQAGRDPARADLDLRVLGAGTHRGPVPGREARAHRQDRRLSGPMTDLIVGADGLARPAWASVHDDLREYY